MRESTKFVNVVVVVVAIYFNYVCMCNKKGGNIGCCTIAKTDILSRMQHFSRFYCTKDTK